MSTNKKKNFIIGLSGGSGSGKTTFISAIKQKLSTHPVTFISLDDYYFPRENQTVDSNEVKNFDLPTAIDSQALISDLHLLSKGQRVERKEYTFNNDEAIPQMKTYDPNPIIFVEGLYIYYYEELRNMIDVKLFIDAPVDIKIIRRIQRDQIERKYPLTDVLYRYQKHVTPSFNKHVLPFKDACDIIINNSVKFDVGLDMVVAYVKHIASERELE